MKGAARRGRTAAGLGWLAVCAACLPGAAAWAEPGAMEPRYTVGPVGWVRKSGGRTWIAVEPRYQPALLGVGELDSVWVLWWFDRNDSPENRAILQVHPRGDPEQPLRGVFATRSPYRPNLIALSRVRVIAVRDHIIEIDGIDAFADTPVLDIKP